MDFFSGIIEAIGGVIFNALGNFFGTICYRIVAILCEFVKLVYSFFAVFAGLRTVEYDGEQRYLINVFFGNHAINNIYWAMALLGIVFIFVFTVIAVIKKTFDLNGKLQTSMGQILMSAGKSILSILLLSSILAAVLNITNLLIDRVSYLFDNADDLDKVTEISFTDEQYATMARIYNTIGNYSLNPSYNSRYNLNSCYNAIRGDLLLLKDQHVFDIYYPIDDEHPKNWQSVLQQLILVYDPQYEVKIDDYNLVSATVLEIMGEVRQNANFYPINYIKREYSSSNEEVGLDRVIFLTGTFNAARGGYNQNPSLTDPVRGPFYRGDKSIYSKDQVSSAFDISISGISYVTIGLMAWFTLKNLTLCIFNCISRIFNLVGLYIVAPPFIATTPLDGGEKFKQWMTSATVQMFGIFGSIIPMRLVMIFIPIILDDSLVLFGDNMLMNILAKAIFIVGAIESANKFGSMFTGILANNAGMEAIRSGDMSQLAGRAFAATAGAIAGAAGTAANVTGVGALGRWAGKGISGMYNTAVKKGGLAVGTIRGIRDWNKDRNEKKAEKALQTRKDAVALKKLERDEKRFGLNQNAAPPAGNDNSQTNVQGNGNTQQNTNNNNNNNNNPPTNEEGSVNKPLPANVGKQ